MNTNWRPEPIFSSDVTNLQKKIIEMEADLIFWKDKFYTAKERVNFLEETFAHQLSIADKSMNANERVIGLTNVLYEKGRQASERFDELAGKVEEYEMLLQSREVDMEELQEIVDSMRVNEERVAYLTKELEEERRKASERVSNLTKEFEEERRQASERIDDFSSKANRHQMVLLIRESEMEELRQKASLYSKSVNELEERVAALTKELEEVRRQASLRVTAMTMKVEEERKRSSEMVTNLTKELEDERRQAKRINALRPMVKHPWQNSEKEMELEQMVTHLTKQIEEERREASERVTNLMKELEEERRQTKRINAFRLKVKEYEKPLQTREIGVAELQLKYDAKVKWAEELEHRVIDLSKELEEERRQASERINALRLKVKENEKPWQTREIEVAELQLKDNVNLKKKKELEKRIVALKLEEWVGEDMEKLLRTRAIEFVELQLKYNANLKRVDELEHRVTDLTKELEEERRQASERVTDLTKELEEERRKASERIDDLTRKANQYELLLKSREPVTGEFCSTDTRVSVMESLIAEQQIVVYKSKKQNELDQQKIQNLEQRITDMTHVLDEERLIAVHRFNELTNKVSVYEVLLQTHEIPRFIIKNVPIEATHSEIESLFSSFSGFSILYLSKNRDDSHNGFGFVEFRNMFFAGSAFAALRNRIRIRGKLIELEWPKDAVEQPTEQTDRIESDPSSSPETNAGDGWIAFDP